MNDKDQLLQNGTETLTLLKEYLLLEAETARLQFLKKIQKDLRTIVASIIVLFFVFLALTAFGIALGFYLSGLLESHALGAVGAGFFYILLGLLSWSLKNRLLSFLP